MKRILNKFIMESGAVIPFEEPLIDVLHASCDRYVQSESFNEEFEELLHAYIKGEYNECINTILDYVNENQDYEDYQLPEFAECALIFYCIYMSICDAEETDAIYRSLALKNVIINAKGQFHYLLFQEELVELYKYFDAYWENSPSIDSYPEILVQQILEKNGNVELTDEDNDSLVTLASIAWRNKLSTIINGLTEQDPFLRAVMFVEKFYIALPTINSAIKVEDYIDLIIPKYKNRLKKIEDIIAGIKDEGISLLENVNSDTSTLLKMIEEDDNALCDIKFTAGEFLVYLYYEMLLETKLKDNGNE